MNSPPRTNSKPLVASDLPERYVVKDNGEESVLTCLEAPNLTVRIKAGLTISASAARKSPPGTIYLDGVAQCEPFMDHEKQVYNLDHHEGCVRTFTLSTCEQALLMIMKGLDLQNRDWKIFANEPDLDTILAIWIIFNHLRISRKEPIHRRVLFALVRLEGIIDAQGLELKELSALPPDLLGKIQRIIDYLRNEEVNYKKEGLWEEIDYLDYTASVLHKIDQIIYKSSDFIDFRGIEEVARVELTDNRIAAVVEADLGIYELEPHLNKLYGNRLGLVILRKGHNTYTLRQMDPFMPRNLDDVYEKLNFIDPAVKCRTQNNKWGGSADIGGSPRATGSQLTPQEIAQACREAMQKPSLLQQIYRFLIAAALVAAVVAAAEICAANWQPEKWFGGSHWSRLIQDFHLSFGIVGLLTTFIVLAFLANRRPWQYGLTLPTGNDWWFALPVVVLAGFAGGVWLPTDSLSKLSSYEIILFAIIMIPLAFELLFRSLVHGVLAQGARIQHCNSRWFLSWPVMGAALLNAGFCNYWLIETAGSWEPILSGWAFGEIFGALVFGLAAGMVRERSQSFLPAYLFHMIAATSVAFASNLF
ncbi:MAG: hypothetical protein JSW39_23315 [Desulfobacterales bacterium]|nr:MAG: hypothetical protein JSW39_23315 [Desulfobacterales bacterium]